MTEQLYVKKGRRYAPWGNGDNWDKDKDAMRVGECRVIYCPEPGHYRQRHGVSPDTAAWVAAAMIAEHAMQEAMAKKAIGEPEGRPYTLRQRQLIEQFRKDMAATGALVPHWWTHGTPAEIARAGIEAVENFSNQKQ